METDLRTLEELAAMPVHRDFLWPRGLAIAAGTVFPGLRDDAVILTVVGFPADAAAAAARPVLDALRPHLGHALSLSARLADARTAAMVEALSLAGVPAAVIDLRGRLRASNSQFDYLFRQRLAVSVHDGTAIFADPNLQTATEMIRSGGGHAVGRSVAVAFPTGETPAAAHLLPLIGHARDIAGSDGVLVTVASVANLSLPHVDLLRLMFDLTPAEARLARTLLTGASLSEAARGANVTVGTARKQLAAVFGKVGVGRQSELVLLLSGLGASASIRPVSA